LGDEDLNQPGNQPSPEQSPLSSARPRRPAHPGWLRLAGAVLAAAVYYALPAWLASTNVYTEDRGVDWLSIGLVMLACPTPTLLATGWLLSVARSIRPFGEGVMIGAATGMTVFGGVCAALASAAIPRW
jgi:hypothetical protein